MNVFLYTDPYADCFSTRLSHIVFHYLKYMITYVITIMGILEEGKYVPPH